MKAFSFPLLTTCLLLASLSITATAAPVARAYDIKNVADLEVSSASKLVLVQGASDSLRVEAEPEVMQRVRVDQDGQRLSLSVRDSGNTGFRWFALFKNDAPTFYLQLRDLNSLKLNGASAGQVGKWSGKALAISLGGASELEFAKLTLDDLQVELGGASNLSLQNLSAASSRFRIGGASDVKVAGQSSWLKVEAGGASDYHGKSLVAAKAELQANGASDIDAHVTQELKAEAQGASDINYAGNPSVQIDSSGASDINAI